MNWISWILRTSNLIFVIKRTTRSEIRRLHNILHFMPKVIIKPIKSNGLIDLRQLLSLKHIS